MGNSWVGETLKIMKTFASDDAARDLYERRLEAERGHEDLILTGVQKDIAIGKLEGKNDALRETARQLKILGISAGTIAQATGLSLEDLRKLQEVEGRLTVTITVIATETVMKLPPSTRTISTRTGSFYDTAGTVIVPPDTCSPGEAPAPDG
jgi:hypothetical protein